MGKTKKAHRKKVAARNQKIKHAQRAYEKWVETIMTPQPVVNPVNPGNFIPLTGSDADKYQEEYINGYKE